MKVITGVVLISAIVVLCLFVYRGPGPLKIGFESKIDSSKQASGSTQPTTVALQDHREQRPGGSYEPSDPRWQLVREKDVVDSNWEWKSPINFYGRVVDEGSRPVSKANVELSWTNLSKEGSARIRLTTDEQGRFNLLDQKGKNLMVRVSKEGYYSSKREQINFDYAAFWERNYYVPDTQKPVDFHLRRKGVGEALRVGEIWTKIPADGRPVRFDLLNGGRFSPDGQLEIAAVTNTADYPPRIFDWRATISIPTGGLVEHNEEFPFEAPEAGYRPRIDFQMPANGANWKREIDKSFFIQFGSPLKYGRIRIALDGGSQMIKVDYAANPSGSRILENKETPGEARRANE